MKRRRSVSTIALAAALCACGDPPAPPVAPVSPSDTATEPQPARRAARPLPAEEADVARIADALAASEDAAQIAALQSELRANGLRTARVLVAWLAVQERREFAKTWLPRLGDQGVAALVEAIEGDDEKLRVGAYYALADCWRDWTTSPDGPRIARLLDERLDGTEDDAAGAIYALGYAGLAARGVAAHLAERWVKGGNRFAEHAIVALKDLGPDAAAAAPIVVAALRDEKDEQRASFAWMFLGAVGAAEPSVLPALAEFLDADDAATRQMALSTLSNWGDAAAPLADRFVALLADENEYVRSGAATCLAAMPSVASKSWRALAAVADRSTNWRISDAGRDLARDPAVAALLHSALPTLRGAEFENVRDWLEHADRLDGVALASALIRSPARDVRAAALEPWSDPAQRAPLPDGALGLLDDPVVSVRAQAISQLARGHAASDDRLHAAAMALLASDDLRVRYDALSALGALSGRVPAALAEVLRVLDDPATDERTLGGVVAALGESDAPIDGDHPRAAARCAGDCVCTGLEYRIRAALRFRGGLDAVLAEVRAALANTGSSWRECGLRTATRLGPRAASIRAEIVKLRASLGNEYPDLRPACDAALAAIDDDLDAYALAARWDEASVAHLLASGDNGLAALVLLAGRHPDEASAALDLVEGVSLGTTLDASAFVVREEHAMPLEPSRVARLRVGVAVLARTLDAQHAVTLLAPLTDFHATDGDTSVHAVASLRAVEEREPGAVPVSLIASALRSPHAWTSAAAVGLAAVAGRRAASIAPDLRARMTEGGASTLEVVDAANALFRVTGETAESLAAVRSALAAPDDDARYANWEAVAALLSAAPADAALLDTILGALRTIPDDGEQAPLVRLLPRFGADAVRAVPVLASRLVSLPATDRLLDVAHAACRDIARVLGSLGPAARDALPALRACAGRIGDPDHAFRDAIARIEGR